MITFRIQVANNETLCDVDMKIITKEQEYRR
jgi:hypothetical protein